MTLDWTDFPNLKHALIASALLHSLFFLFGRGLPSFMLRPPVEVEITSPFLGTGPARLAPPKAKVMEKGLPLPAQKKEEQAPTTQTPPQPAQDWTAKTSETQKVEKAQSVQAPGAVTNGTESAPSSGGVEGGKGISPLPGGIDGRSPYGTPTGTGDGGAPLLELPRLLNKDELLAMLRKYYPENERRAGHEGDVLLKVHIAADGSVSGSEVVHADSSEFAAAAQRVALLMRFSPARDASGPRAVAMKVPMQFRLRD